jgi:hypothetical protein
MIELLQKTLPIIVDSITKSIDEDLKDWDSLVINRRKPHTYRMFRQFGDYRVCLHRFESCSAEDAFLHPHPWPAAFLLLEGEYIQTIGGSTTLEDKPNIYMRELIRPRSMYEIVNPTTWHSVQPLSTTYTVMINGAPFVNQHKETRTTKGKDLEKMTDFDVYSGLMKFESLLRI